MNANGLVLTNWRVMLGNESLQLFVDEDNTYVDTYVYNCRTEFVQIGSNDGNDVSMSPASIGHGKLLQACQEAVVDAGDALLGESRVLVNALTRDSRTADDAFKHFACRARRILQECQRRVAPWS